MSQEEGVHLLHSGYPDGVSEKSINELEEIKPNHAARKFLQNRFTDIFIIGQSLLCVALSLLLLLKAWYPHDQLASNDPTLALYCKLCSHHN
jgi:hypothetical protein